MRTFDVFSIRLPSYGWIKPALTSLKTTQVGTAAHELGHALGFFHPMSRHDRDKFLTINLKTVRPMLCLKTIILQQCAQNSVRLSAKMEDSHILATAPNVFVRAVLAEICAIKG
ncbi:hypothetical protein ANCCEY_06846 [Ancylostoma ceylanicum]|uniref:Metalloendopeptidase n=1 Tax=Ancylostoma ceylanicum TaxID=53326 RepID=A0A0D6LQA2_9BILA|nr:hypothetical protein ANCCEY_06846 [Ancylostoma ceylanicum]